MLRGWFNVKVELLSGRGMDLVRRPGRVMLVGPKHTLQDLAEAIDLAFARWDISHLHEFEFPDGRRYGTPDEDFDEGDQPADLAKVRAGSVLSKGVAFSYVFDLGDDWRHGCLVQATGVDPEKQAGIVPEKPIPIWGWGWIPDQYGRRWEDDDGEEDEGACPVCGRGAGGKESDEI